MLKRRMHKTENGNIDHEDRRGTKRGKRGVYNNPRRCFRWCAAAYVPVCSLYVGASSVNPHCTPSSRGSFAARILQLCRDFSVCAFPYQM